MSDLAKKIVDRIGRYLSGNSYVLLSGEKSQFETWIDEELDKEKGYDLNVEHVSYGAFTCQECRRIFIGEENSYCPKCISEVTGY